MCSFFTFRNRSINSFITSHVFIHTYIQCMYVCVYIYIYIYIYIYGLDGPEFETLWRQVIFSSPKPEQTGRGAYPANLNGYQVSSRGYSDRAVALTTHPHLALNLGLSRAMSPLPRREAWHVTGRSFLPYIYCVCTIGTYTYVHTNIYTTSRVFQPRICTVLTRAGVGRDNSVGIATRYGLDDPGIECRCGARFSAAVQTGPVVHPASYSMGTRSFPG